MAVEALLSSFLQVLIESSGQLLLDQLGVPWGLQREIEKLRRTLLRIQCIVGDAEEKQIKDPAVKKWLTALRDVAYKAEDVLDEFQLDMLWKNRTNGNKMIGKVRDFFSSHNPLYFRLKMARKLKEMVKSIDDIAAEGSKFNFAVHTQAAQTRVAPETYSYVVESDVIGRDNNKEEMIKLLIDHDKNKNVSVLAMTGMGGVGKTTLAQLIYRNDQVEKHFQLRLWVWVSDVFDLKEILQKIISSAKGTESDLSNMELLQRGVREALSGKRYLLVLDDVWTEHTDDWDRLKALLDCGGEGSTVVVTTRSDQVSSIMGSLTTYRLGCLSDEDSWNLFRERAFAAGDQEEPQNLVEIGKAIVKKCGGLPLAVKTVGSLMRCKSDEREWSAILESDIWDISAGEDLILPALRLSYNNLPSHLKRCFAFCAIFPKGYEIEEDMLIQLWMAQGFIPSEGPVELEVKGHQIFKELVRRSFFQDVKQVRDRRYRKLFHVPHIPFHDHVSGDEGYEILRTCKMHDLIHDLAQDIIGKDECVALLKPSAAVAPRNNVHHLSMPGDTPSFNVHETLRSFPALRTLLVRNRYGGKTMEILLKSTTLRVLAFPNYCATTLSKNLAQHLKHVRYLDLSHTAISELPEATTTLLNLQTLKLSQCENLRKLPSDMKHMINLRHLYLDGCDMLKYMPEGLGRLSSLQTLSKYIVGADAGRRIGELKTLNLSGQLELYNLRNVRGTADAREANIRSKPNLDSLALCWGMDGWTEEESLSENVDSSAENAEAVLEELKPPDSIKVLSIWGYGGVKFPSWMADYYLLPRKLGEIHLGGCRRCQLLPSFWQLPFLKVLILKQMDAVKHIICGDDGGDRTEQTFPALKRLILDGMPSLEQWLEKGGRAAEERYYFPCLTELIISGCSKLGSMPLLPSLKNLKFETDNRMLLGSVNNLTTLVVLDIGINNNAGVGETISSQHPKEMVSLRHLKFLEQLNITGCKELELQLVQEDDTKAWSLGLRKLMASDCDWLFSSQQSKFWKSLVSLKYLDIGNCGLLTSFPEELRGLKSLKALTFIGCDNVSGLSPTSSSSEGELPPQLEWLCIACCSGLRKLPRCPASLTVLIICHCTTLMSLTEDISQFTSLDYLEIEDCPILSSLPLGMEKLRWMEIKNCPKLKSLPEHLPNLESLVISGCPELKKQCKRGGKYWHLVSRIPDLKIEK